MNIHELETFNLGDAVKFNSKLNPQLWDKRENLLPEVRKKLLEIAEDFQQFLALSDLEITDITFTGSNASYTYTDHSDIDLHLVVDLGKQENNPVFKELFNAKKYQYNDQHNIKIHGYDVELYVQPVGQEHYSNGIYSVAEERWVHVPVKTRATIDHISTRSKYEDLVARIDKAVSGGNFETLSNLFAKIKDMRQTGLATHGEFGPENLAFKMLRKQGYIQQLVDAKNRVKDQSLSLAESIKPSDDPHDIVMKFAEYCADYLKLDHLPEIQVKDDEKFSKQVHTFGRYRNELETIEVQMQGRHILDVLRTLAHEMVHYSQDQREDMPADAGKTGSPYENEAHAVAGIIMRHFDNQHPEFFTTYPVYEALANEYFAVEDAGIGGIPGPSQDSSSPVNGNRDYGHIMGERSKKITQRLDAKCWTSKHIGNPKTKIKGGVRVNNCVPNEDIEEDKEKFNYDPWDKKDTNIAESSGYIPTEAEATDPRYIMALSHDVHPGALGLEANKLGLEVDSQGHPALLTKLTKKYKKLKESIDLDEDKLFEVAMSPSSLRALASKIDARAGMEFEMYVPGAQGDSDDYDQEPDMDYNESAYSISQIADFFHDGDYNGRREVDNFRQRMEEDYLEWRDNKISDAWDDDGFDFYVTWVANNIDEDTIKEFLGKADDEDYTPNKNDILDYANKLWGEDNSTKHDAYEEFREEKEGDDDYSEEDWLDSEGISDMEDAMNSFGRGNISWPYWNDHRGGGNLSIDEVADDFSQAIGKKCKSGGSYHSTRGSNRPDANNQFYIVETDGSLDEPDSDEDSGLEFVSPAMPIEELFSDLDKIKAWANTMGCYTNDSTGLHMNVSVPGWTASDAGQGGTLDYVKLVILMGDQYVLDQFDRASNTYCASGLTKVQDKITTNPELGQGLLSKMKGHLNELASRALGYQSTNKYTSANIKDGYIEFRSPGGDWLKDLSSNEKKIENTMLRFVVALDAATDPEKYRQEYLKKLYKILAPSGEKSTIEYFSKYVAGELPKAALRSFIKQAQLERKIKREGTQYWWRVDFGGKSAEVVAANEVEAIKLAAKEWGVTPDSVKTAEVTNIGRHSLSTDKPQEWVVTMRPELNSNFKMYVMAPSAYAAGELVRASDPDLRFADLYAKPSDRQAGVNTNNAPVRATTSQQPAQQSSDTHQYIVRDASGYSMLVTARNTSAAMQWARDNYPDRFRNVTDVVLSEPNQTQAPAQPSGQFSGQWKIMLDGEEVYQFGGVGNNQADANRIAQTWIQDQIRRGLVSPAEGAEIEVLPVMI